LPFSFPHTSFIIIVHSRKKILQTLTTRRTPRLRHRDITWPSKTDQTPCFFQIALQEFT
jgi:hypothetical protein